MTSQELTERNQLTQEALTERPISRRRLLQGASAAGLTIVFSSGRTKAQSTDATPVVGTPIASPPPAPERPQPPTDVDSYIRINEDGTATLLCGKVEYGQGIQTGFGQLIAEELNLPFESVEVIMGKTDEAPFDIGTFGSLSTRVTGPRIRQAAAGIRIWLLELGAEHLGRGVPEVDLKGGSVIVIGDEASSVSYAELAAGKQSARELDPDLPLKDPATFTVIGQPIPRIELAHKTDGSAKYGIDTVVDGMVYGHVVRPPAFGATLESIDFSAAEDMPGVVGTFRDGDFAALVTEQFEQGPAAVAMVKATWTPPDTTTTDKTIHDVIVSTADEGTKIGDDTEPAGPDDVISGLSEPLEFTYRAPYVNHAPIEPRSALVQIEGDRVSVWSSTQDPFSARTAVARIVGTDLEKVVVTPMHAGGAFGSKITPMAEPEAAKLAKALGKPVKIIWRREEEFQHGQYRPAMLVKIVAGLDAEGHIAGWQYDLYSTAYFPEGAEEPSRCAADWSADAAEIYGLTASKTMWYQGASPLPPYFWRVNGASTNTFAREVTIDALAERAGVDPVTFRKNHLADNQRMLAVMEAAVAKSGWTPAVGSSGQGIGIALVMEANSYVAEVAQVEVDKETGVIRVKHVTAAVDCGLIVNPQGVTDQIEGAIVLSSSAALKEKITFENGRVTNPTFEQYGMLTMREAPSVDVVFVEDKNNPMGGIGEPGVAPLPAAVANAVYDAIGVRLSDLPFTPDRVLAALNGQ
jgi:nicotinate dehydrogenase subunit B